MAASLVAFSLAACANTNDAAPETTSPPTPTTTAPTTTTETPTPPYDPYATVENPQPTQLKIPSLGLDHPVVPSETNAEAIDPPKGTLEWYNGLARVSPGDVGTAIISGHVAWGSKPDIFQRLSELQTGQTFTIGDNPQAFTVTDAFLMHKEELPDNNEVWGENRDTRRIVLITCDDALGYGSDGHRTANYVVIAEAK